MDETKNSQQTELATFPKNEREKCRDTSRQKYPRNIPNDGKTLPRVGNKGLNRSRTSWIRERNVISKTKMGCTKKRRNKECNSTIFSLRVQR